MQHPNDKQDAPAPREARGCLPQETAEADQTSRRAVLRSGAKLAFAAPVLSTLFASQAYAANYSCYAVGHVCPGDEACCGDLVCNSGACSEFCVPATGPCITDSDCCSADCDLGICK